MPTFVKSFNHASKTHALSEHLASVATELGPDAKLPTIQELRRELGVSVATLDNALTQLESQKIIYRKHGVGIFVSPHVGRKSIALVCDPSFFRAGMSPFWQEIIEGARAYGVDRGESCRFYLALPSAQGHLPVPDDLVEDVQGKRIDGVLFIGDNRAAVEWIWDQNVPVVAFAGWSHWMVAIDYPAVVRAGLETLRGRQCRDVGLLLPYLPDSAGGYSVPHAGIETFKAGAREQGMSYQPQWIWNFKQHPEYSLATTPQEQGYNAIISMYEAGFLAGESPANGPQGLVCLDDLMTRGALVAMQKLNIRLGQDVQIATHSNRGSSVLHGYENELTRLEIDPNAIVTSMFACLKALLMGEATAPHTIYIGPQVV